MNKSFHIEICRRSLGKIFSPRALEIITKANIKQDHIRFQYKHPHFHFDSNTFDASYKYVEQQHRMILNVLRSTIDPTPAWQAFGRLTHTVQDFYAHTNFIQLWIDTYSDGETRTPSQVNPIDPKVLHHPALHSGDIHFWDWLAFIPGFYAIAYKMTQKDSHTHMNLDQPDRGDLFSFALEAAIKRTVFEFQRIAQGLNESELNLFIDN